MATVTQSEFDIAFARRSQEDHKRIMEALRDDGSITIVPDEELPEAEPQTDENGEPLKDSEGNVILSAPEQRHRTDALEITVDNEQVQEEGKIPEDYLVQVAPGTQNVAQPFPENEDEGRGRGRRGRRRSEDKSDS